MSKRKASSVNHTSAHNELRRSKRLKTSQRRDGLTTGSQQHNLPSPPHSDDNHTTRQRQREEGSYKRERLVRPRSKDKTHAAAEERCSTFKGGWSSVDDWIELSTSRKQAKYLSQVLSTSVHTYSSMTDARPSQRLKRKPSGSSKSSYSQGVREGRAPAAHTPQHEDNMRNFGLYMGTRPEATITKESLELCKSIVRQQYALPAWFGNKARFLRIQELVRLRNEASIMKHLTPFIMPSPETLAIDGYMELEHITESLNAAWDRCAPIHGRLPKPDVVLGVSESAFTAEEIGKLAVHSAIDSPTIFSEKLYYPFLICEVESSRPGIQESERQAMHSGSIAVKALVQLYLRNGNAEELSGRILVFSVSQNHDTVKIFGHFAMVVGDVVTYHRQSIYEANLNAILTEDEWTRPYQIMLAICQMHFPEHLRRIRDSLAEQPRDASGLSASQLDLQDDSQGAIAAASSQEDGSFKRPSHPSSARQQQEIDRLRSDLADLLQEQREQRDEARQQRELLQQQAQLEKEWARQQLEQQREEFRKQQEQHQEQMYQQREESRKQQEKLEARLQAQQEQHKEQMDQQREIMVLLRQSLSGQPPTGR